MNKRPGGKISSRPLHFIFITDCSGSMGVDGKIQALNQAIREAIPAIKKTADENPNIQVYIRCIRFGHGASWHIKDPLPINSFKWVDLKADPLQQKSNINTEIVFLVDTSGSMFDEIEAVKSSCINFAGKILQKGINLKLGLIGFDIGGYIGKRNRNFALYNLSTYTIGVWPLAEPEKFRSNIESLELRMFGGEGCYLADKDTVDIFPYVVKSFTKSPKIKRILVIISDEMGTKEGLKEIVSMLKEASITAYVLGVRSSAYNEEMGAHELIAKTTGGRFWDIDKTKGKKDFSVLLENVAETIAKELVKRLDDGTVSKGTDMGKALSMVAEQLKIPPMESRAVPPVLLLVSDGKPTDSFEKGLKDLMSTPWGRKSIRLSIAIGKDADIDVLQKFIGNVEIKPLKANNPEQLINYIKFASTSAVSIASAPPSKLASYKNEDTQ